MATFLGCEYHISTVVCPVPIKRWPQLPEKDYFEPIEVLGDQARKWVGRHPVDRYPDATDVRRADTVTPWTLLAGFWKCLVLAAAICGSELSLSVVVRNMVILRSGDNACSEKKTNARNVGGMLTKRGFATLLSVPFHGQSDLNLLHIHTGEATAKLSKFCHVVFELNVCIA